MAVDGKNASGRLAAATVLWLLVAIFANQDFVNCSEEENQYMQRLQQQQLQQQQQQQQRQQQPQPMDPQQLKMSQEVSPQMPLSVPPQISPSIPQQPQQPQNQQQMQQMQQMLKSPQNQQQERPMQQQESPPGMLGPVNNFVKGIQTPESNQLSKPSINPDFGTNFLKQPPNTVEGPLNMMGSGPLPSFSGRPPIVPTMQAGGSSQVPTLDDINQGINQQFRIPSGSNLNTPSLQTNSPSVLNKYKLPTQSNDQNSQGYSNNVLDSMNYPHRYQMQYASQNHYRPSMVQQKPFQQPIIYSNRNSYEDLAPSNTPASLGQSNLNRDDKSQPAMNNMLMEYPMALLQTPMNLISNALQKVGTFSENVGKAFELFAGNVLDKGQAQAQKIFDIGSTGSKALVDMGRIAFTPSSGSQQTSGLQQSGSSEYGYNPYQPPPTNAGYNMQPPPGAEQFSGGNGQPLIAAQRYAEYPRQRPSYGMNNPINAPQPIVRYG